MRKNFLTIIAILAVFVLVFAGCGNKEAAETTTAGETASAETAPVLGLAEFSLSTTTWSSPNGATVHLNATPSSYAEGQAAAFVVRLEGEEIANIPCEWDGNVYTASAELNAANDLCYYVILTGADGSTVEVPVNTPSVITDEALINMETSLHSYCNLLVDESAFESGKLTITAGAAQVQVPTISNNGEAITVSEAKLVLSFNGEEVAAEKITLEESESVGGYELALTDITFEVPEMENDQQLVLTLDVVLSNGHILNAAGGTFYYNDGEILTAVG